MTAPAPTLWPVIDSRRDTLPRGMSYPIRLGQLTPCFGLTGRKETWLSTRFENRITDFTGAQRKGLEPIKRSVLYVYQDSESSFDFHHLFIDSKPWRDAEDPLIVHAHITNLPASAARICRDAVRLAMEWLAKPETATVFTPGSSRAWQVTLDVDSETAESTLRIFAKPVRDFELTREFRFKPADLST